MTSQGPLFRLCRQILRLRYFNYRCHAEAQTQNSVVYICRHRNATGPISSLCLLPLHVRPWAFSVFMDTKACMAHLKNYTFPVTWKIGPMFSGILATTLGPLFARLVRSTGAVPVYRNSLKVKETYKQTIEVLTAGDSVLIFPDINYAEKTGETGALYEGFLLLDRLWNRKTGEHVQFVPVNVSISRKTLTLGKPISFTGQMPYREEKDVIVRKLENALDKMTEQYGV